MGRRACCDKIGLKKGPWSADEDKKLREFILSNGTKYCWRAVPKRAELLRCGKSCRLRWANYLRPDLKNDRLSKQEEKLVIDLHSQFGNKWSKIASHLNGRTDNYIKNYWHNHIKKQLCKTGIDSSITHKPLSPNKSQKKANKISRGKMHNQYKGRQEIYDETSLLEDSSIPNYHNHHLANEKLTLDAGFSIHEIPLIKPHEILIPPHSDLSSHYCSSSSNLSTPTASTTPSSSTINLLIVEKLKSLPYWHGVINDYCRNNNGNIGYSNEDDFTEWNSLINELDIDKIDHELFQPPPSS